jgi:hypothetical protein
MLLFGRLSGASASCSSIGKGNLTSQVMEVVPSTLGSSWPSGLCLSPMIGLLESFFSAGGGCSVVFDSELSSED